MKNPFIAFILLFIAANLLIAACRPKHPCPDRQADPINIARNYRDVLPYNNTDTFYFKHSNGNTYPFVSSMDSAYVFRSEMDENECVHSFWGLGFTRYLKPVSSNSEVDVLELVLKPDEEQLERNVVELRMYCNGLVFVSTAEALFPGNGHYDLDSLSINNFTYHSVSRLYCNYNYPLIDTLYYNNEYGILKFTKSPLSLSRAN